MVAVETPEYLNTDEKLDQLSAQEMLDALENKENRVKVWENISDVLQKKSDVREKLQKISEDVIRDVDPTMKNELLDLVWAQGNTKRGKQYFKSNPSKAITAEHRAYMGVLCLYDQLMFHEVTPPKTKGKGYMEDAQSRLKLGTGSSVADGKENNKTVTKEQKEHHDNSNFDDLSNIDPITPKNEPVLSMSDDAVDDFSVVQPIKSAGSKKQESNINDQEKQKDGTKQPLDEDKKKIKNKDKIQDTKDDTKEKDKKEQLIEEKKVETVVQPVEVLTTEKYITITEVNSSYSLANRKGKEKLLEEISRLLGIQDAEEGVHYVVRKEKTSKDASGEYVHTIEATVIPLEENRIIQESPNDKLSRKDTVDDSTEIIQEEQKITQEEQKTTVGDVTQKEEADTIVDESSEDTIPSGEEKLDETKDSGLDEMLTLEEKEYTLKDKIGALRMKILSRGYTIDLEPEKFDEGVRYLIKKDGDLLMHIGLYTQGYDAGMFYLGIDDEIYSLTDPSDGEKHDIAHYDWEDFDKIVGLIFYSESIFETFLNFQSKEQ